MEMENNIQAKNISGKQWKLLQVMLNLKVGKLRKPLVKRLIKLKNVNDYILM